MAWATPQYRRDEVNTAGNCFIAGNGVASVMERDQILEVINNWRSSHSFPLNSFQVTLHARAKKIDSDAVVAQRLKRLSSIDAKLRRFPDMKLSQMQDIGGIRAIVRNVHRVERLIKLYKQGRSKNPTERHEFLKEVNYIHKPKDDGYRSVHLIYRYRSKSKKHKAYNGLKIEIQLRSRLQHAWATAVETVSTFTGQALKSSGGEEAWRRFFALMGSAIALRERQPLVPGTPTNTVELIQELRDCAKRLKVESVLDGWRYALRRLPAKNVTDAAAFLLFLDPDAKTIRITGFGKAELPKASEKYLTLEKTIESQPGAQAVLVSVDSLQAVRSAYPNYYLDTTVFIKALRHAIN
jgi:hypothetical protein